MLWVAFPAILLRALALGDKRLRWLPHDGRGFLSDLVVAATLGLLVIGLLQLRWKKLGRAASFVIMIAWVLVNGGNHEHVAVLDSNASAGFAGFLTDGTFLVGSVGHVRRLWLLVILGVALPWGASRVIALSISRRVLALRTGVFALAATLLLAFVPASLAVAPWRLSHFVEDALGFGAAASATIVHAAARDRRAMETQAPPSWSAQTAFMRTQDLSGTPTVPGLDVDRGAVAAQRPNVLLVLIEGVSGPFLPSIAARHGVKPMRSMHKLDAIAARGMTWSSFINHNRQTDRGEYSALCGDYPELRAVTARMRYIAQGARKRCLPETLKEAGYRTAYLQAADLAFMSKGPFMHNIGFDEVRGRESFSSPRFESGWGVDDQTLFDGTLEYLDRLRTEDVRPWFVTVLTVGTHHPYLVPDDFEALDGESGHARAVRYSDDAVARLVQGLRDRGLLDNTLVLIGSDEASGLAGERTAERVLDTVAQSWGFLVALLPGGQRGVRDEVFFQSDLAVSVLDYLGLRDEAYVGRSVFRAYPSPRPVVFAHVYSQRIHFFEPDVGRLHSCTEDFSVCAAYSSPSRGLFGTVWNDAATDPAALALMREAQSYSVRALDSSRGKDVLQLYASGKTDLTLRPQKEGRERILGGLQLYIDANKQLRVSLDLEVTGGDPGAKVELLHWLNSYQNKRENHVYFASTSPTLTIGDRFRLEYTYAQEPAFVQVDARVDARISSGDELQVHIHGAQIRVEDIPPHAVLNRGVVTLFDVTHRSR